MAVGGLHGRFIVTESIWSRKPKILSETTTWKNSADLWCTQSTNSKFCMCVLGGVGWSWFVLECLLEFILMRSEWPRWNVIARGCGRSRFSSPCLRLRKLLCGSFLPFCTALVYKVCFLGEVGEKQMWAERSEVGGRVLSILLTSSEKWCLQVWAIGIKRVDLWLTCNNVFVTLK